MVSGGTGNVLNYNLGGSHLGVFTLQKLMEFYSTLKMRPLPNMFDTCQSKI